MTRIKYLIAMLLLCSLSMLAESMTLPEMEKYINTKISAATTYKACTTAYVDTYNYINRTYPEKSTERKVAQKKLNKVYTEAYIKLVTEALKGKVSKEDKANIYKECLRLLDLYPSDIRLQSLKNSLK